MRREEGPERGPGQEHGGLRVLQLERQLLWGVRRIERHIGAARLQNAQGRDDRLEGSLQEDPDEDVGPDTQIQEAASQSVGPVGQLPVGQHVGPEHKGDGFRGLAGSGLEKFVDAGVTGVVGRRFVPFCCWPVAPDLRRGPLATYGPVRVLGRHNAHAKSLRPAPGPPFFLSFAAPLLCSPKADAWGGPHVGSGPDGSRLVRSRNRCRVPLTQPSTATAETRRGEVATTKGG